MSKIKQSVKIKLSGYLKELSIVIIGVAITLFASNMINSIKEKKDLKIQLSLIYEELEDNILVVDSAIDYYRRHEELREILLINSNNPENIRKSILNYDKVINYVFPFTYKKSAYEMFLNSGAMKLLTDRELLLDITKSYAALEATMKENDAYVDGKHRVFQEVYQIDKGKILSGGLDLLSPEFNSMYNYLALVNGMLYTAEQTKEQIEKVLSKRKN